MLGFVPFVQQLDMICSAIHQAVNKYPGGEGESLKLTLHHILTTTPQQQLQ